MTEGIYGDILLTLAAFGVACVVGYLIACVEIFFRKRRGGQGD